MRLGGRRPSLDAAVPARHDRLGSAAPLTFAIVCLGRVGSDHLVQLLGSNDDIRCFGELFNPLTSEYALERRGDHHEYLDEVAGDARESAVGCKLTWPTLHSYPMLFDLLHDPTLRVIRLVRPNYLAVHVSACHARATGLMHAIDGDVESRAIKLDRDACLVDLFGFYAIDCLLDELTRHNPVLRVEYEDLGDGAKLAEVQRFLGVEPKELSSSQRKIVRRPLQQSIENYDEIAEVLHGTVWEPFLAGERQASG